MSALQGAGFQVALEAESPQFLCLTSNVTQLAGQSTKPPKKQPGSANVPLIEPLWPLMRT